MSASSSAPRTRRALVVEDDPLYATLYREMLASAVPGIEVELARNGYVALLHLARERPDLIILDLHMPGFSGFELLDIVKRKHGLAEVPILVVSSAADESTRPLRALPGVHVFAKPLRPALLKKLIRQAIPDAHPATPARSPRLVAARFAAFVGEDWDLQRQIALQFFDLAPDRIARIADAARRHDLAQLREWCHTLVGTASMLGAEALEQLVARLRQQLDGGEPAAIAGAAEAVIEEIRQIALVFDRDFDLYGNTHHGGTNHA